MGAEGSNYFNIEATSMIKGISIENPADERVRWIE